VNRRLLALFVAAFMLLGVPCYAYADPSGGTLFQILMPMLAAIWGMWMIFAGKVRRFMASLLRKLK
jgi:hypothetical protein